MESTERKMKKLLEEIEAIIRSELLSGNSASKRADWRTYHQRRAHQMKLAMLKIKPLIDKASSDAARARRPGRKPALDLSQKVTILVLQKLLGASSRKMAYMVVLLSAISGKYIGYKTAERLHSDTDAFLAIVRLRNLLCEEYPGHMLVDSVPD